MNSKISELLFRSLGTHALKEFSLSGSGLKLVVAPWDDLDNEAVAVFSELEISYIEADCGIEGSISDFSLPWDIIRFDSHHKDGDVWEFGLCCSEIQVGFRANMPQISF
ncbi:hypothetical protein L4C54_02165 [Vibrio lamellibrachiae]|uniref:hypothetical protein n=1 Tax=Vibrio lamellibrachiae TaxID=2910253 RepID=UPI003D136846